jgi:hypothetical protein
LSIAIVLEESELRNHAKLVHAGDWQHLVESTGRTVRYHHRLVLNRLNSEDLVESAAWLELCDLAQRRVVFPKEEVL